MHQKSMGVEKGEFGAPEVNGCEKGEFGAVVVRYRFTLGGSG